jgi:hypothetical protein
MAGDCEVDSVLMASRPKKALSSYDLLIQVPQMPQSEKCDEADGGDEKDGLTDLDCIERDQAK